MATGQMATDVAFPAAPDSERASSRQDLPAARRPLLQRLMSDNALVKDSLEPAVSQGWKNLPATWLTSSPTASKPHEQTENVIDAQNCADEQPSALREHTSQDNTLDIDEAQPDADRPEAADLRGTRFFRTHCTCYIGAYQDTEVMIDCLGHAHAQHW